MLLVVALIGTSLGTYADQTPGPSRDAKKMDKSKSYRVASPNRTYSKSWGNSHRHSKPRRAEKSEPNTDVIVWVDATGKTIGRALSSNLLLPFQGQLALIAGLDSDRNCDANDVCTFSGGIDWNRNYSVYYTSSDCSGAAYSFGGNQGTPVSGVPVFEGDTYIYLSKSADTTRTSVSSYFINQVCYAFSEPYPVYVAPVTAVIPASDIGVAPYSLK